MKKIIIIPIICIVLLNLIYPKANAISNIINDANAFIKDGETANASDPAINNAEANKSVLELYKIIMAIAYPIVIGVGFYLGYQLLVASVDEKAKAKEVLIAYIVGVVVIIGSAYIWRYVVNLFNN